MQAEVVIIGGGIIGTSVAMHLARAGCTDVVVVERGTLANGSSSKGVGGFRQQFSTEINVRLSQLGLPTLLEFGEQIDLHQNGYLYLALSAATQQQIAARVAQQQAWNVPVELLSPDEVAGRWPALNTADVHGAAFCPLDGYARPPLAVQAYAREAQRLGVRIVEHSELSSIELRDGHVVAAHTTSGRIGTRWLVNAAGPHAAIVAALAGVPLLVAPQRRQTFLTEFSGAELATAPMTIDEDTGFHFRPEGGALRVAMSGGEPLGVEDFTVDTALGERMLHHARHRLPTATFSGTATGRAGLYEMTPDAHPVLGPVPSVQGLLLACGFSGHGFMHAAAAGRLLAEYITTGSTPSLDITPLSITRFAEGRLLGAGHTL